MDVPNTSPLLVEHLNGGSTIASIEKGLNKKIIILSISAVLVIFVGVIGLFAFSSKKV